MEGKMSYDNAWTIQGYKVVWQAYACINDVSPTRPARITRYRSTQKAVPVRWMLCLPDCVLPSAVFRTRQHSDAGNIWYSSSLVAGNGGTNAYYIFYKAWTIQGYIVVCQAYARINAVSPTWPARITRYRSTQKAVPVRWMLCLPDCVLPSAVFRTRQHSDAGNIWGPMTHVSPVTALSCLSTCLTVSREATIMCQNQWVSGSSGSLNIFLFDCLTTHRTMSCWFSGCFYRQQECQQCNKPQNTWSAIAELGIA